MTCDSADPITLPPQPASRSSKRLTIVLVLVLVAIIGALVVATYAIFAVAQDRNGWRDVAHNVQVQNDELRNQVAAQSSEIACRSRANFDTVRTTAEVIKVIAQLVDASGQHQPTDGIRTELAPAIAALDAAIEAQSQAIPDSAGAESTCSPP